MTTRLVGLLPVLVCAVAFGLAANAWDIALWLALVATALAMIGPRWDLDLGRQLLTTAMGAGAGYALVNALYDPHGPWLSEGWARLAAALMLAGAARFVIAKSGRGATIMLLFAALVAIGQTRAAGYTAAVAAFLVTTLAALAVNPALELEAEKFSRRRAILGAGILLLAAGLAAVTTETVRVAQGWLVHRGHLTALIWHPRVGFSDRMDLDALAPLLDSDTLVLRVRGPRVDYLRGSTLDYYEFGRWLRSDAAEAESRVSFGQAPASADRVEITALAERSERFFVPLRARAIVTSPPSVLVDGLGSIKRVARRGASVVSFTPGPRDQAVPSAPTPFDVQVPRRLRPQLTRLAEEWAAGKGDQAAKLDAIELRFYRDFRYAKDVKRNENIDPVIDFLQLSKAGHCEYFATAFALLARSLGVPARVVTGYRVAEESPFGYYVVRERNAHSWVEVFDPARGWTTRDPTPESFVPQNVARRAGYAESLFDAAVVAFESFTQWLGSLSVLQTAIGWGAGLTILAWIIGRGARRRRARRATLPDDEAPLPPLARLLSSLERAGYVREPSEPLERLARRLSDPAAASLLTRYTALRYGGVGDPEQWSKDAKAYVDSSSALFSSS